jgi:branched-chain amino acid transport system substrate-binding protein
MNRSLLPIGVPVALVIAAGCSASPPSEAPDEGEEASELLVGVATAQSGFLAPYDQPALRGLQLRVDEINQAGGIGGQTTIKLVIKDTRSDAAQSAVVAQELLGEGIDVLLTPCDADPSIAAGQMAQAAEIPAISLCASTPTLPASVGDYMFSNFPGDNFQGWVAAKYAVDQGYETAFVLKSPDTAYTNKLPEYFSEAFEGLGGEVVETADYSLGQQNFDAVITNIKNADPRPDVIETAAYEPDFPAFIKALRGAGVDTPVIGADAIDTPTTFAIGDAVEGVVFTTAGVVEPGNPMAEFEEKYEEEYGEPSGTIYAPIGYDLGIVLEEAVQAADGDLSGPNLRDAIANLEDVEGITSPITYAGTDGMPVRNGYLVQIENGERTVLDEVTPDPELVPAP